MCITPEHIASAQVHGRITLNRTDTFTLAVLHATFTIERVTEGLVRTCRV